MDTGPWLCDIFPAKNARGTCFVFEVLSPVSHERWPSDEDNRKFGTEVNQNLFPLHGSGSCFTEPADHEGKAVQYVMLRVNGRKRIITILLTDQIIRVTVFRRDSISITYSITRDQYFSQVFKCPKTFWMWCLHHQKCHQQKATTKFQKADVMPYQNLTNQLHPKKWARFFHGWLPVELPGSFLEDVARLGLFAHGDVAKEGWPGREFAGIGADRISVETVTWILDMSDVCVFFFWGEFLER